MSINLPIPSLLKQIQSKDQKARLLAIKRLGMIYDNDAIIQPLLKLLLDSDPKIRESTILSLSTQSNTDQIIKPIINTLNDEDLNVQLAAIKALSEFRSILATKPLIKVLSDPNDEVRAATVLALGLIGDKNSLFPLIDCLEDDSSQVRINALGALSQLEDPRAIDPILEVIEKDREETVKQMAILSLGPLGQNNERIIDPLVKILKSTDPRNRQFSIVSLGRTKSPKIIPPLLNVINDEDPFVRQACAQALSEIKDPKTVNEFIQRLEDTNDEIRELATRALGKLGDVSAVPSLIKVLKDPNKDVREEAAISLGELASSEGTRPLISALKKEKLVEVKKAIIKAIGSIEGKSRDQSGLISLISIIRPLTKSLSDEEISIRSQAAESLAKIYINKAKFGKARTYYERASQEALTWEFRQPFYSASAIGCGIMDDIANQKYFDRNKDFHAIYEDLSNAAKMLGNQSFLSENYWKIIEIYNKIFLSKNKTQFVREFKDLGLKLLLLAKKLPEGKENLLDEPQDRLNEKFQMIDKRGLPLTQSIEEMENLKENIFDIGKIIMQIEPLELRLDEEQQFTISSIENLTMSPGSNGETKESIFFKEQEELLQRHTTAQDTQKFVLEEVALEVDPTFFAGQTVKIGLVQYLIGSERKSLIEDQRNIWERFVQRYYDYDVYKKSRILQFTQESIQLRAKPKIIGFLDDCIYEQCKLIVFPELSIPESYLPKLQEFADRFSIFIIAGVESQAKKGRYYNRAYLITPLAENMLYQQKNSATVIESSEIYPVDWMENIEVTNPPRFSLFNSPFGRFIIMIGNDIKEHGQYIPFIAREKNLDFVILLNNGVEPENGYNKYLEMADESSIPVIYINSGQFGGTGVYEAGKPLQNLLQREYSEGIFRWNIDIPSPLIEPSSEDQSS